MTQTAFYKRGNKMATKYMKNILRFTNNERNTDKIM